MRQLYQSTFHEYMKGKGLDFSNYTIDEVKEFALEVKNITQTDVVISVLLDIVWQIDYLIPKEMQKKRG